MVQGSQAGLNRRTCCQVSRLGRDREPQSWQDSREMTVSSEITPMSAAIFPRSEGLRSWRPFLFCRTEHGHQTDLVLQGRGCCSGLVCVWAGLIWAPPVRELSPPRTNDRPVPVPHGEWGPALSSSPLAGTQTTLSRVPHLPPPPAPMHALQSQTSSLAAVSTFCFSVYCTFGTLCTTSGPPCRSPSRPLGASQAQCLGKLP